jgi:hypothetical protein
MVKVQRPSQFKMITFWRRRRTLEGRLGRTGMETQTMLGGRPIFFIKTSITDKILAVRLEGLFWARSVWDVPLGLAFGLGLCKLHTMAVQVERPWEFMAKGLDFGLGLGLWRLHTMPGWRIPLLYLIGYFQLIYLDSQQSLATQSHGLSTWTAIVWSGPYSLQVETQVWNWFCFVSGPKPKPWTKHYPAK